VGVRIVVDSNMIITDVSKLHIKCDEVSSIEEENEIILRLEKELLLSNERKNYGIGLAAPQIGINKRVAIVRIADTIKLNLVNSKIIEKHTLIESTEGCLSLPNMKASVIRYNDIMIQNGSIMDKNQYSIYGLASICVQHEMDHWEGVLISDRINIGPNMPCICGSKIKYKKCCGKGK